MQVEFLAPQGSWRYHELVGNEQGRVAQIRKGAVELAVLGLLADQPRYGSQLVEELADYPALALSAGTIYPLLARLKKADLIDARWEESPVGPPRKYYSLTTAGRAALASMTDAWRMVSTTLNTILEAT